MYRPIYRLRSHQTGLALHGWERSSLWVKHHITSNYFTTATSPFSVQIQYDRLRSPFDRISPNPFSIHLDQVDSNPVQTPNPDQIQSALVDQLHGGLVQTQFESASVNVHIFNCMPIISRHIQRVWRVLNKSTCPNYVMCPTDQNQCMSVKN